MPYVLKLLCNQGFFFQSFQVGPLARIPNINWFKMVTILGGLYFRKVFLQIVTLKKCLVLDMASLIIFISKNGEKYS